MTITTAAQKKTGSTPLAGNIISGVLPVFLIFSCGLLAFQPELRLAVPLLIGVTALMATLLALALYWGERAKILWSPSVILAVAFVLRLLFLLAPPQLSDDIYRYLWDGSNLIRCTNPYTAAPSASTPPPELAAIHSRINHPDYVTIYPPAAQLVFAGGAALGGTVTALKALLVLIDIGLTALLIILLKRLELPVWRAVLYAWNPLPVLEIAGSGHVDGAGLTLLMGAFCMLLTGRKNVPSTVPLHWPFLLSGALLACAGLVKLFPFVLAPVLYMMVPAGRRMHFATGFIGTLAALLLPFMPHLVNMSVSLDAYARNWEFAGFAFNSLRALTNSGTTARLLLSSGFLVVAVSIMLRLAGNLNRTATQVARGHQALEACYAIAMTLLLLTPTLQPWYALCLAVFLPFCAGQAGLVLCWAVFLTYQVQIPYFILGQWTENPLMTAAVFLAPVTAFVSGWIFRKKLRAV